jgi:hypothetical protein
VAFALVDFAGMGAMMSSAALGSDDTVVFFDDFAPFFFGAGRI